MTGPAPRGAWLSGSGEPCASPGRPTRRYHLVLLGPPGVGKGTQAAMLSSRLGPCHLSTGGFFRIGDGDDARAPSPAMAAAVAAIARGEFASDEMVLTLVRERMGCLRCEQGFLLDGFPRTVPQADALDTLLAGEGIVLDAVLSYELPVERIVARLAGRRVCPACAQVYHVESNPPSVAGACDACRTPLVQRDDDHPDVVGVRMLRYASRTQPVIDFYAARGLLHAIEADGTPEQVFAATTGILESLPLVSGT